MLVWSFVHFLIKSLKQGCCFLDPLMFSYWQTGGLKDAALWLNVPGIWTVVHHWLQVSSWNSNGGRCVMLQQKHEGKKLWRGWFPQQVCGEKWLKLCFEMFKLIIYSLHPVQSNYRNRTISCNVIKPCCTCPTTEPAGQTVHLTRRMQSCWDTRPRTKHKKKRNTIKKQLW